MKLLKMDGTCKIADHRKASQFLARSQNQSGHDYGHHVKAAANMGSKLLAQELKKIAVQILHPGFNKTGMTQSTRRFGKSKAPWTLQLERNVMLNFSHGRG